MKGLNRVAALSLMSLVVLGSWAVCVVGEVACAGDRDDAPVESGSAMALTPTSIGAASGSSAAAGDNAEARYGPFGLFDSRSAYGTGFFPEPFLVDEGDLDKELELSWIHQEGHGNTTDVATGEVEWSFGLATVEVEAPWERDAFETTDPTTGRTFTEHVEGMDAIQATLRHPIWQYVNAAQTVDNTVVIACEVALPTNSRVGHDAEVVPEIFDLLRLGEHFGFQTHVGYSTLYGQDTPRHQTLEYSADFSYQIDSTITPMPPDVLGFVPMVELAGYRGLNTHDLSDELTGLVGFRVNLDAIGPFSPRLGIGYIFPIDKQDREGFSWGVATSLVFDL